MNAKRSRDRFFKPVLVSSSLAIPASKFRVKRQVGSDFNLRVVSEFNLQVVQSSTFRLRSLEQRKLKLELKARGLRRSNPNGAGLVCGTSVSEFDSLRPPFVPGWCKWQHAGL